MERKKLPHSRGAAEVELASLDGATLIRVWGEVDVAAREQLRVAARWAADRDLPVRIDVSGATLLDTSGVELLTRLATTERNRGRSITVVGASSRIKETLELTGLGDLVIHEER